MSLTPAQQARQNSLEIRTQWVEALSQQLTSFSTQEEIDIVQREKQRLTDELNSINQH